MHEIKPIIDPLPREELLRELTPDRKAVSYTHLTLPTNSRV